MTPAPSAPASRIGDAIALTLQELQRHGDAGQRPLVRIDARREAAAAPFQLDVAAGRLHRAGCRALPERSRTALYGLWELPEAAAALACPRCRPGPRGEAAVDRDGAIDYLFGLLSTLDQFGGVIRERGREFRESTQGRALGRNLGGLYSSLGEREREVLGVVLTSLDGLITTIADLDSSVAGRNGADPGTARNGDGNGNGQPGHGSEGGDPWRA